MKFFLSLVILAVSMDLMSCFSSNDLCFTKENKCNETKLYKHQCSTSYCAKSEHICKQYSKVIQSLKSLRILRLKMALERMFEDQIKKLDTLIKSVSLCKGKHHHTDVCLNNQNCLLFQKLPLRFAGVGLVSIGSCPCTGSYSFACSFNYCAKNKHECDVFLSNKSYYSRKVTSCKNKKH